MKKIISYIITHNYALFLVCLLCSMLYVMFLSYCFPIRYEDNDDITYAWIASGIYTGSPDSHLVFLNALYGSVIAGLYTLISGIEWYTVLFICSHAISAAVCAYLAIKEQFLVGMKIAVIASTLIFLTYFVLRLQFTTVAAFTAFAGLLLLCQKRFIIGGGLLIIGSLIRFEAAGLMGVLMMPLLIYSYKFEWQKSWIALLIVFTFVGSMRIIDGLYYRTPEWQRFMTCCNLTSRGKINDNPNLWRIALHLPKGVSKTNFKLVAAFAPDPEVNTPDMLMAINETIMKIPIAKKTKNIYQILIPKYKWWFLGVIIMMLPLFFLLEKNTRWLAMITLLIWLALLCIIQMDATVKWRVFIPTLLPILAIWVHSMGHMKIGQWMSIGIVGLLGIGLFGHVINHLKKVNLDDEMWLEQRTLLDKAGNSMVITDGPVLQVELIDAFDLRNAIPRKMFINPYCFSGCPLTPAFMSYRDFVNNDLLLFTDKPIDANDRINAIYENYGIRVIPVSIAESEHYALVKIVAQ